MQDLFNPWMHPFSTALVGVVIVILLGSIRMAQEYQRAVIFLLGRVVGTRGPGLFLKLPFIERAVIVDLRTITTQLETQETVTSDGVPVKVKPWFGIMQSVPQRRLLQCWIGMRRFGKRP